MTSMHEIIALYYFPIFEYCLLKFSCRADQLFPIGVSDSYDNLASPTKVKQNLYTFTSSGKLWVSIKSFVQRRCASASSSGLPSNSGLKCDQFSICWCIT